MGGANTMGRQIYGGMYILWVQPFEEGDIITLDTKTSRGGADTDMQNAVVTGFVEQIGVCSTLVRRFDMRCTCIPNSLFIESAVNNWNSRPRKLISLDVAIS